MRAEQQIRKALIICVVILTLVSVSFAAAEFKTIDTPQLHSMVVDNTYQTEAGRKMQFAIIDVRPREEYDQVHIFGAINIPEINFDASFKQLPSDKNALLVVYGNSVESGAGKRWAEKAVSSGYTNIAIYKDSLSAWIDKHLPVLPISIIRR